MQPDIERTIRLTGPDGAEKVAVLKGWESSAKNPEERLELQWGSECLKASSKNGFFEAFRYLRADLENRGLLAHCWASAMNVYPSPMGVDMGPTHLAYKTTMGKPATDLIDIFDSDPAVVPVTVEEQEAFHKACINGLGQCLESPLPPGEG